MKKDKLVFEEGSVSVEVFDNVIYLKITGSYDEHMASEMMRYLDKIMEEAPGPTIRVWDATDLSGDFSLTGDFIEAMAPWGKRLTTKHPRAEAYFIVPHPLAFGVTRMYEMRAETWGMKHVVLSDFEQLPPEIRKKIPR